MLKTKHDPAPRDPLDEKHSGARELRRKAEAHASEGRRLKSLSPGEMREPLHELRVHRIELEMQNEELRRTQAELETLRAKYFDLYDLAPVGYLVLNEQNLVLEANLTAANLLGENKGSLVKKPITRFLFPEDQDVYYRHHKLLYKTDVPQTCELRMIRKDGSVFWAQIEASPAQGAGGLRFCRAAVNDITDRIRSEEALHEAELKYRTLVENAQEAIVVAQDGILKFVNQMALGLSGYSEAALLSLPFLELIHPDDRNMVVERHRMRLSGDTDQPRYAFRLVTHGGNVKWVEISAVLIDWCGRPATLNFLTDITDRRKAEDTIQTDLREKEVLLREIHHRVKNNMQVISSLLNLQAEAVADGSARSILKEGQLRIRAMALVHEKLYRSRDLSRIDFAEYLQSLTDHLFHFFAVGTGRVRFKAVLEPIDLDINTAVPCGLIFHELASNALKHAFPNGREGIIEVGLGRKKDGTIRLRITDNGVGFPADLDFTLTKSFGLQIANLLAGQIDGTITLDRSKGTSFTLSFREMEKKRDPEPGRGLP